LKIGVFDSGLGGLAIAQAIIRRLPQYDYMYLGDTKRVPYGGRSQETIHEFTSQALSYLFDHECQLVILACNTASAEALRKSQQEYLPRHFPDRRVLGMIIPTAEAVYESGSPRRIGVLATSSTVESRAYERELLRQCSNVEVYQNAAPLLVPLIENEGMKYLAPILDDYLRPLIEAKAEAIVLGCTHYCLLKKFIRDRVEVPVVSQDEVIPEKLADYLRRHPEIEGRLSQVENREYHVTDITSGSIRLASEMANEPIQLQRVVLT
jgi:glutamate racemase